MSLRPNATPARTAGASGPPSGSPPSPAPECCPGLRSRSPSGSVRGTAVTSGRLPTPGPRAGSGASG
eukprot:1658567-Alexandrium_andersonii.AAC.1